MCSYCKRSPMGKYRYENDKLFCQRCYHFLHNINPKYKEEIINQIDQVKFTCIFCESECGRTLQDNEKHLCCLCSFYNIEKCNLCETRFRSDSNFSQINKSKIIYNNIVSTNLDNPNTKYFKDYLVKYWELSIDFDQTFEHDPIYYRSKKKQKKKFLREKRRERIDINDERINILQNIINLQLNNLDEFLLILPNDKNYKIQRVAFRELGRMKHPGVLEYLITNIESEEYGVNWEIFELLRVYGQDAIIQVLDMYLEVDEEFVFNNINEELLLEIIKLTGDERVIKHLIWYVLEADTSNKELTNKISKSVDVYGEKFWEEVKKIELTEGGEMNEINLTEELRKILKN